jgi:hypothetical protein
MSSMLEQAIVDAAALREAALKNAEQAIIEKYAPEIKNAVENMLNESPMGRPVRHEGKTARITVENDGTGRVGIQYESGGKTFLVNEADLEEASEQDILQEEEMEMMAGAQAAMPPGSDMNIPLGATGGEAMCPCPDDEDSISFEFSMDDFKDMAASEPPGEPMEAPGLEGEEGGMDLGLDLGGEEEEEEDPLLGLQERKYTELLNILEEISEEKDKEVLDEDNEELEEDESLDEELIVDMGEGKGGWHETNEATLQYQQEMQLAKQESTKYKEENEALQKKLEELDEAYNKLSSENELFETTIYKINDKFKSTLVSNAKLLYSNRVLRDASLNERQKSKIVEAINKARNPEEAKALWETLRTTVGSDKPKKGPQSLSESVNRRSNLSSMLPRRNTKETKQDDTFSERMRKLAGIK